MRLGARELIFLLLLVAMPVAAYFMVFEPRNQQIREATEEIRQKQLKLKQLEAATGAIADLGLEIDKLTEAINVFEQKLPAQREVEVVLQQVWELAAAQKLVPKSVRTDKLIRQPEYSELPIKMTIVGNFDGFYAFLLDLEKMPRITQLPMLSLKKAKTDEGEMQAEMVLTIFFERAQDTPQPKTSGGRS
ncbi:MAG: type 4a pilus biogenesis protein PilO [Phycisphaeraceae bacterium]|nr:type 4a pilus biogenesis protein PilO [Phycisphaeraceae bacterium]